MTKNKETLVIGASEKTERYSNKAVRLLREFGYPVLAIGGRKGKIDDVTFSKTRPESENIDTVTLYINAHNQQSYYDYILSLNPKRVIFNPGAENKELKKLAEENGIETLEACTLVLLHTRQY